MIKLYSFSKKIHRILTWIVAGTGSVMTVTGISLKYGILLDPISARVVHSLFSTYFVVALVPMSLTGIVMWFYPYWQKKQAKNLNKSS